MTAIQLKNSFRMSLAKNGGSGVVVPTAGVGPTGATGPAGTNGSVSSITDNGDGTATLVAALTNNDDGTATL